MENIKVNSLEAVLTFAVYICAQDKEISTDEIIELIQASQIMENSLLFTGEFLRIDIKNFIEKRKNDLLNSGEFLGKNITENEENYYSSILTDSEIIDLALRVARISASIDGFHRNENYKFRFWLNKWN